MGNIEQQTAPANVKLPYSLSEANERYDAALAKRIDTSLEPDRPIIGVTTNLGDKGAELARPYWQAVRKAGGVPMLLPPTADPEELIYQLEQLDGLLLTGGADVNPLWADHNRQPNPKLHGINPERDLYELQLCRLAHQRNVPILGICRGIQVMAMALGGSIYQDIESEQNQEHRLIKHSQDAPRNCTTHFVNVLNTDGALSCMGYYFAVNSFHHQAVKDPGPYMSVSAKSDDGVIEAIENYSDGSFLLGVQWHPECLTEADADGDPYAAENARSLFESLVSAAELHCRALNLHASITTLDSHCDTPMMFPRMIEAETEAGTYDKERAEEWMPNLSIRNPYCLVDHVKASEGRLDEAYMVSYIPQGPRTTEGYAAAKAQVELTYQRLQPQIKNSCYPLYIHFGIENGYALGRDTSLIKYYKEQCEVEYITLCHNGHNDICDSARPKSGEPAEEWGGLSPFGREVVKEMNRQGVLIDLSHASEKTFYEVLELSEKPVAVTHACCRALCNHPRNLTDEQLRAIAAKGGVVQCTMYPGFLVEGATADPYDDQPTATIHDFMRHLEHMIEVCGIDHVGIGSDFDGDGGVPGLSSASDMIRITERLLELGYPANAICKIWGDNFRRVVAAQGA